MTPDWFRINAVCKSVLSALHPLVFEDCVDRVRSNSSGGVARNEARSLFAYVEMSKEEDCVIVGICVKWMMSNPGDNMFTVRADACRNESGEMVIWDIPTVEVEPDMDALEKAIREQGGKLVEEAQILLVHEE